MNRTILLLTLFFAQQILAQNVVFNKIEKTNSNKDKFLYTINPEKISAEFLGEIEVQGFSSNDAEVFGKIYKKAKEIGANAFSWKPFETLEGQQKKFDEAHYRINLYYLPYNDFPKEDNVIYLISSPAKKQTIAIDGKNVVFEPRTFRKLTLQPGAISTISTRKLLGSSIKVAAKENQPVQYFQFSGFSVNTNHDNSPGINLKSGDIIKLEQSYGMFLTTIYSEVESN